MEKWLLQPPVVFITVFVFLNIFSHFLSKLAARKTVKNDDTGTSYACGEDVDSHMAQPDYSQFFPFAFFFTIAHVATMMLTAIPIETVQTFLMAELYIVAVIAGLFILLRK